MVFYGKARWHDAHEEHGAHGDFTPHESPRMMVVPLVVLAGLSIVGGVIQLPFSGPSDLQRRSAGWLEPVVASGEHQLSDGATTCSWHPAWRSPSAVAIGIVGACAGLRQAQGEGDRAGDPRRRAGATTGPSAPSWAGPVGRPSTASRGSTPTSSTVRSTVPARWCAARPGKVRKVQSGYVRNYAAAIGAGVVLLLVWFVVVRGIL